MAIQKAAQRKPVNARKVKTVTTGSKGRLPNPRGQGELLRGEILAAAREILEESGTEEAMTLRATARVAGITAPAIYAHFAHREEMVEAVVAASFDEFAAEVLAGMDGIEDPDRRLREACRAYVDYAHRHPATYRVIFTRHRPAEMPGVAAAAGGVFAVFVDLLAERDAARGARRDAKTDATLLWLGMHGLASLPPSHPRFSWPDQGLLIDELLERLTGTASASGS